MKPSLLSELTLYRYRYVVGYVLFVIFVAALMFIDISSVPNGISDSEMKSAVASNSLNPVAPRAVDVINLPYHLLQKLSIGLFGLSPLTIRLPSLVLILVASGVLAAMLHYWFRRGIAVLALLIAVTSTPFITFGRTGTAAVLYMLLLLVILLAAVKLTTKTPHPLLWKAIVLSAGLLLFYIPFGIYAVFALAVVGVFHPHIRYQITHTKAWHFILLGVLSIALLTPIIISSILDHNTLETLLGVNDLKAKLSTISLSTTLAALAEGATGFYRANIGQNLTPAFSLPFVLFILFGLVRTISDHHAARSYLLHVWLIISIPLLFLASNQFALLFVPCLMLMAIGLETFLREWYRLFPRNPYARIGALVPLSLIIVGIVAISASRYFASYYYTDTTKFYHPELRAVNEVLKPHIETQLVVPDNQIAFYDILRADYSLLTVVNAAGAQGDTGDRVVLNSAGYATTQTPNQTVTSHLAENGVLLRVYGGAQ